MKESGGEWTHLRVVMETTIATTARKIVQGTTVSAGKAVSPASPGVAGPWRAGSLIRAIMGPVGCPFQIYSRRQLRRPFGLNFVFATGLVIALINSFNLF